MKMFWSIVTFFITQVFITFFRLFSMNSSFHLIRMDFRAKGDDIMNDAIATNIHVMKKEKKSTFSIITIIYKIFARVDSVF